VSACNASTWDEVPHNGARCVGQRLTESSLQEMRGPPYLILETWCRRTGSNRQGWKLSCQCRTSFLTRMLRWRGQNTTPSALLETSSKG